MYPTLYEAHSEFNIRKMDDLTKERESRKLAQLKSDEARKND
jgi:hypothetical protein